MKTKRLGDLLVETGYITEAQLQYVLQIQKNTGEKLGEILIQENMITERQMIEALEFQMGIPHMDLNKIFIDPKIPHIISENLARKYGVIPVKKEQNILTVAMIDPLNIFAIDDMELSTGFQVKPIIATKSDVLNAIQQYYETENAEKALEELKQNYQAELTDIDEEILQEINNAPVVKLINSLLKQAVMLKASDIHIEPFESIVRVRMRVDGDLQEIMQLSKSVHSAVITRIKIMGKMNIAEKRLPQDGRVEIKVEGKEIDLRLSVLPTVHGEKMVIRLLDRSSFLLTKSQLGFLNENLQKFNRILQVPNGIVLVTGPTGSGKSTTLYSALYELNQINKNIITVEDPVEYQLAGINQVQVNNKAGLTFASSLRAILRQDPDIIMIGEMRDAETAQIAVRAAITGHLVLSTIHTNDTASTITRLMDMGLEPYLVSSSVSGIVAQRLVKRVCENCKTEYIPEEKEKNLLGLNQDQVITLVRGKGCSICNKTGYKGRIAIHEVMEMTKEINYLIDNKSSVEKIREKAMEQGMITLQENCKQLVLNGITTIEEMKRVTWEFE